MLYLIIFAAVVGALVGGWMYFPVVRAYICFFVSYMASTLTIVFFAGKYPEELAYIIGASVAFFGWALIGKGLMKLFPSARSIAQGLFWGGVFTGGHVIFLLCRLRGYF